MPEKAIKFIRDVEEEAALRIRKAEESVAIAEKNAQEEARKRRESAIFKLKNELKDMEAREGEKARLESERIEKETEQELIKIRELQNRNREKAVELVVSSLFKGD